MKIRHTLFPGGMLVASVTESTKMFRAALLLAVCSSLAFQGVTSGQVVNVPGLSITDLGVNNPGTISQFALNASGDRLYVSRFQNTLEVYDYSASAAVNGQFNNVLSNRRAALGGDALSLPNGSLGLALHESDSLGTVLYTTVAVPNQGRSGSRNTSSQTIRRLNDLDGDGIFGEGDVTVNGQTVTEFSQDVITGLQVTGNHQTNNLQIVGNSLFFGTGTRTCSGGDGGCNNVDFNTGSNDFFTAAEENAIGEFAYTGAINFIENLNAIADTTTSNIAGIGNNGSITGGTTDNNTNGTADGMPDGIADDLTPLVGALADNGEGVFRVFSNGVRNPFGITADDSGTIIVSENQQEGPRPPDRVLETSQFEDHGFDSFNGLLDDVLATPNTPDYDLPQPNNGDDPPVGNPVQVEGDFRTSTATADARDDGFFDGDNSETGSFDTRASIALTGITTISSIAEDESLRNDILVAGARGEVLRIDRETGDVTDFIDGIPFDGFGADPTLDVFRDPTTGFLLVAGGDRIFLVSGDAISVPEPSSLVLSLFGVACMLARRVRKQ